MKYDPFFPNQTKYIAHCYLHNPFGDSNCFWLEYKQRKDSTWYSTTENFYFEDKDIQQVRLIHRDYYIEVFQSPEQAQAFCNGCAAMHHIICGILERSVKSN